MPPQYLVRSLQGVELPSDLANLSVIIWYTERGFHSSAVLEEALINRKAKRRIERKALILYKLKNFLLFINFAETKEYLYQRETKEKFF